jgi:hypothetical protein
VFHVARQLMRVIQRHVDADRSRHYRLHQAHPQL